MFTRKPPQSALHWPGRAVMLSRGEGMSVVNPSGPVLSLDLRYTGLSRGSPGSRSRVLVPLVMAAQPDPSLAQQHDDTAPLTMIDGPSWRRPGGLTAFTKRSPLLPMELGVLISPGGTHLGTAEF